MEQPLTEPFLRRHFTTIVEILLIVGFEYMVPSNFWLGLALWALVPLLAVLNQYDFKLKVSEAVAIFALAVVPILLIYRTFYALGSPGCLGCGAWDDSRPLERVYGSVRPFRNETVVLDARHFIDPVFDGVTFVYQGTGPVQMDNPRFVNPAGTRFGSTNKLVNQTLEIVRTLNEANGCHMGIANLGPVEKTPQEWLPGSSTKP